MMKLNRLYLLFAALMASTFAFSQEKEDAIDKALSACLGKPGNNTTVGMCDCISTAIGQWDKKLNTTYKALQAKVDTAAKSKLVEAQREWVKYKEKEIALIDATIGKLDGTMWQPVRLERILGITKTRTLELADLLDTLTMQ